MIDLSVRNVVKAFEVNKNILDGLTFEVNEGERVGLLGKNGAGKTTLFRLIVGELESDSGDILIGTAKRVGLISQIPVYPPHFTAEDVLKSAHAQQYSLKKRLEQLELDMSRDSRISVEYDRLLSEFERLGGYDIDIERNKVANGLSIPADMRSRLFSELSGGEKTRVNLARLILENTDILLLDEPTNHLDIRAAEWLEDYLLRFKGTVLVISHDRYFLDAVVTRIVELAAGKADFYSGNYSFYVTEKQARFQEYLKRYERQEKEAKRLSEAADRLYQWGTGNKRLMKKSFAIRKRIERLRQLERPVKDKHLRAKFSERDFLSDDLLSIRDLSKSFGDRLLFSGINLDIKGGESIALLGENGSGKTTLLNIILGSELYDGGFIKIGPAVKAAYLPQIISFDNPARSVLDTVIFELNCSPQTARNRLGAFNFSGEDVFKPVFALSGGERSRLRLCILMNDDINLLILDEPTNHLDIDSREWIENALEDYNEALLFVSHDRYFVNRFAARIWELDNGAITDFDGDFSQYRQYKERLLSSAQQAAKSVKRTKERKKQSAAPEKRLIALERDIDKLETKLHEIEADIEINAADYEKLCELFSIRDQTQFDIDVLYKEWAALSENLENQ